MNGRQPTNTTVVNKVQEHLIIGSGFEDFAVANALHGLLVALKHIHHIFCRDIIAAVINVAAFVNIDALTGGRFVEKCARERVLRSVGNLLESRKSLKRSQENHGVGC